MKSMPRVQFYLLNMLRIWKNYRIQLREMEINKDTQTPNPPLWTVTDVVDR